MKKLCIPNVGTLIICALLTFPSLFNNVYSQGTFGGKIGIMYRGATTWYNTDAQACDGAGSGNLSAGNEMTHGDYVLGDYMNFGANVLVYDWCFLCHDEGRLRYRFDSDLAFLGPDPGHALYSSVVSLPWSSDGVCGGPSNKKYEYVPWTGANALQFTEPGLMRMNIFLTGYGDPFGPDGITHFDSELSGNGLLFTVIEPTDPSSQTATAASASSIDLSWTQWNSTDVIILRNTSNSFTAPTHGTSYSAGASIGSSTVVHNGSGTSLSDGSLSQGTTYYYKFYTNNNNYYGTGVTASATTESCTAGSVTASHANIIRGNDITWTYSGSDFDSYEFQWNGTGGPWTQLSTSTPYSWGACCSGVGVGTLYIRAKAVCGVYTDYSTSVSTYWDDCYAEDISATIDGASISEGGSMTINETVSWTWPHDGSGAGAGHSLGYSWDTDPANDALYNYTWTDNPQVWNDFAGTFFTTTDRKLFVQARSTGDNSCTNYSNSYHIKLKKPEITVSVISNGLTTCSGSSGASESFTISANYIKNADGVTITAPSDFEVSSDNTNFSNNINLGTTDGTVASTTIYVRINSGASSGSPSGNVVCSSTSATSQNVAVSGTVDQAPAITSASLTDASTCGIDIYDLTLNDASAVGSWTVSPVDAVLFNDPSSPNTEVTASPVAGGFNANLTFTWTESAGVCSGVSDNVLVKFNQPVESISQDTDTWIWGGNTSTSWSTASNWYKWDGNKWEIQNAATPSTSSKVNILSNASGGICVNSSNFTTILSGVGSLNVESGSTVNLSGSVSISGDIINNGTINYGTSTLNIDGSADQTISGGNTTLNNLTVSKSSGNLIVDVPLVIKGALYMDGGNIVNSETMTVGISSAIPGSLNHVRGIVTGQLRRYFANAVTTGTEGFFPIGDAGVQRETTVNFTSAPGTDQYLTASYNAGVPMDGSGTLWSGLPLTTGDGTLIENYSEDGYWQINPTNDDYDSEINSKAYYLTLRMNGVSGVTDYTKVRIIKSAGSNSSSQHHKSWSAPVHSSTSGTNTDFATTVTSTGFSFFGGGGGDGGDLPIELISFNGSCTDGVVDLTWQTASEYNSSYYDVEHSRDGATWNTVNSQPAAGNSTDLLTYSYTEAHVSEGDNYYRLTQVDIDGKEKTYDVINASCTDLTSEIFTVYPNPSSGSFQVVLNNSEIIGAAVMNIVDTKGMRVHEKTIEIKKGNNIFFINQELSHGIYFISISNADKSTCILKHSIR